MLPFYEALAERFHELHSEILRDLEALPDEALDWMPGPEMNSVSIITVHTTGSIRFWVGDVVMQESSHRNRDAEFLVTGLGRDELVRRLTDTETYLRAAFEKLTLSDLETERLHPRQGYNVTVASALLHALDHAATHVGHIQLTTQLWHQHVHS